MNDKLVLKNVSKTFGKGESEIQVLKNVSLHVKAGEFVAIVGPSGAGKSTFLSIAGALLTPSSGSVAIGGEEIQQLSEKELNRIRLEKLGFIFQSSNLLPYLTVRDQLLLVSDLSRKMQKERAEALLERLGLSHRAHVYPESLSGGERQRVAIARAWMNDPEIILADEPTASLDSERGRDVVKMLADEVKYHNKGAIMVTHDKRMLDVVDRIVYIEDGRMFEK